MRPTHFKFIDRAKIRLRPHPLHEQLLTVVLVAEGAVVAEIGEAVAPVECAHIAEVNEVVAARAPG